MKANKLRELGSLKDNLEPRDLRDIPVLTENRNRGSGSFGIDWIWYLWLPGLKGIRYHFPGRAVYVFVRRLEPRDFAREFGAVWSGGTLDPAPEELYARIDATPAWKPVVEGFRNLIPVGRLVYNAIRKEAGDPDYLLWLQYPELLGLEKELKSVANITSRDVEAFLHLAAEADLRPEVKEFLLENTNRAMVELREGGSKEARVLIT